MHKEFFFNFQNKAKSYQYNKKMIAKGRDTPSKVQNQSRAKYEISSTYSSPTGPKNAIIRPARVLLEGPTHSMPVKRSIPFFIN